MVAGTPYSLNLTIFKMWATNGLPGRGLARFQDVIAHHGLIHHPMHIKEYTETPLLHATETTHSVIVGGRPTVMPGVRSL